VEWRLLLPLAVAVALLERWLVLLVATATVAALVKLVMLVTTAPFSPP
jgi:hypothetical protein